MAIGLLTTSPTSPPAASLPAQLATFCAMHRRAATVVSLALLGVSACSGSGGSAADAPTTTPDSTVEVEATVEDDTVDTAEPTGAVADGRASEGDFCAAISAIQSAEFELEETFGPEARDLFGDVQGAAPQEIASDVATVIETLDAIAAIGISTDENDPIALEAASEILLDPDFTDANENLVEYTSQVCGIDLDAGDDGDLELDDLGG
jgi:hypothetical protein